MNNSCAIATDDTVTCWGDNRDGQNDAPAGAFETVAISWAHTCALEAGGDVVCWGFHNFAQTEPLTGTYRNLDIGNGHSCAIADDDTIACWGNNDLRPDRRPGRNLQDPHQRLLPQLRDRRRRHHRLLGRQLQRTDQRPVRHLQGPHRQRHSQLRDRRRRHHRLLGRQHLRPEGRPGRKLQGARLWPIPQLRDRHRRHHHLLGRQPQRPDRRPGRHLQDPRCRPGATVARSPPTTPVTCWGRQLAEGQRQRPGRYLQGPRPRRLPQLRHCHRRHGHLLGLATATAKSRLRPAPMRPCPLGASHSCAIAARRHHLLLGQEHQRPDRRPDGHLQGPRHWANNTRCAVATDDTVTCWPRPPEGVRWAHAGS